MKAAFRCSDAAFLIALILLDRYLADNASRGQDPQRLTKWNVHRLFLASLVVTVKYNEDFVFGNSHYAKAGGVHLREVNRLERFFLRGLDYNLHVQPEQYEFYENALEALCSPEASDVARLLFDEVEHEVAAKPKALRKKNKQIANGLHGDDIATDATSNKTEAVAAPSRTSTKVVTEVQGHSSGPTPQIQQTWGRPVPIHKEGMAKPSKSSRKGKEAACDFDDSKATHSKPNFTKSMKGTMKGSSKKGKATSSSSRNPIWSSEA